MQININAAEKSGEKACIEKQASGASRLDTQLLQSCKLVRNNICGEFFGEN